MIPNVLTNLDKDLYECLGLSGMEWTDPNVVVVVGSNGSGKSLVRRVFSSFLKNNHKIHVIHLSQQGRSTSGFGRCMIYGSEDDEATGVISAKVILGAHRNSLLQEKDHVLILDEPEIGMSDEARLGSSVWLRDKFAQWPEKLRGIIVMTHSWEFATHMMELPKSQFIWLGNTDKTLIDWVNRDRIPVDPETMYENGIAKWREIESVFKRIREEKHARQDSVS